MLDINGEKNVCSISGLDAYRKFVLKKTFICSFEANGTNYWEMDVSRL